MELKELIQSIDIVDFISQYIDLEKRGDEWWGLSCFRDEKTPSFSVRKDPPFFYDYSAGFGGNVFTFAQKYFKATSSETVDILKKYAGIEGEIAVSQDRLRSVSVFRKYAPQEKHRKESTATVLPDDFMTRYEHRPDKLKVWVDEGISQSSLAKFQVCYDAFSDRLVYPVKNMDGKIVNIGGRALDPNWKEEGQPKYCYFYPWGTINTIYGASDNMEAIQKQHEIILFEGCKSVLIADTWGIYNTGAILTSHLSENQMMILARLGHDVVFALDKDVNVLNDKNIMKLKRFVKVYFIFDKDNLLEPKDAPVDRGKDAFQKLYDSKLRLR